MTHFSYINSTKIIFILNFKVKAVKYLFKYIYKGKDRAQLGIVQDDNDNTENSEDEIQNYLDLRYISAIEGVWHIYGFNMHGQDPSVMRLDYHLENQNTVTSSDDEQISTIVEKNKLTWFKLNTGDSEANQYLYNEIHKFYIWKSQKQVWQKVRNNCHLQRYVECIS